MSDPPDYSTYLSPFTWRYSSEAMRSLWSEHERRLRMRRIWLALAEAQHAAGLVTDAQWADLERTADKIDIARAIVIEETTRHDVMAEILTWSEQAPEGGAILHLGATSADIVDNVDALRIRDGLALIRTPLVALIRSLVERVEQTADVVTQGWTHLQPAAPTTVGYRLAGALQDFMTDLASLDAVAAGVHGKGFKGAIGTGASYAAVLEGTGVTAAQMEATAMARLGLAAAPVTSQVYPRKQDWLVLNALAGIAGSASTLAFNARILQSPPFGEWSEGFAAGQVGSTAMPWKRNPVNAETVTSLARYVAGLPIIAWQNEATNLLERTLDDSANRRIILPEAFLATDEILHRLLGIVNQMLIDPVALAATLARYGPFAASENVLLAATLAGGHRQVLHERIKAHSMAAWQAVERGETNPLPQLLAADTDITRYVDSSTVLRLVADPRAQVGDAPARAREMARRARAAIGDI